MFCQNANQGLERDLRNVSGYAEPIAELEEAGLLGKEIVFVESKQLGEFLQQKREEILKNPHLFSDKQKRILDEILKKLLGKDPTFISV